MTPRPCVAVLFGGRSSEHSISLITALGVLRLVESGVVQLGDPVRPILGDDLTLIDDAVTIEHLLGHTSGIGDYLGEAAD